MRPVILDTDPGIDDALAILLAIISPEVTLQGVTVTGGIAPCVMVGTMPAPS